ncbi:MAG: hypothetical protein IPJ06_12305 [Saprospiraceae bacterium]|nr:hypothetical protein [Saprospiraceae bacterium]
MTHIDHGVGAVFRPGEDRGERARPESCGSFTRTTTFCSVGINSLHKLAKYIGKDGTEPQSEQAGLRDLEEPQGQDQKKVKDIAGNLLPSMPEGERHRVCLCPGWLLQNELEASFIYEDTPDQFTSTTDVRQDMERANPWTG